VAAELTLTPTGQCDKKILAASFNENGVIGTDTEDRYKRRSDPILSFYVNYNRLVKYIPIQSVTTSDSENHYEIFELSHLYNRSRLAAASNG